MSSGEDWPDQTGLEHLRRARESLAAAGVEDAARSARLLLAEAMGVDAAELIAREQDRVESDVAGRFDAMLARRRAGEPVSRIRGWKEFRGRRFETSPDVLDPRPETELLVEAALELMPAGARVLDLGVGSGCILLSLLAEHPDAAGVGVDLSALALVQAARNVERLGLAGRVELVEGGWAAAEPMGPFDWVVSNPPYIPSRDIDGLDREVRAFDPHLALDGGADGLDAYRALIPAARRMLKPGGWIALEVGAEQAEAVLGLLAGEGFNHCFARRDLSGWDRVVLGRAPMAANFG